MRADEVGAGRIAPAARARPRSASATGSASSCRADGAPLPAAHPRGVGRGASTRRSGPALRAALAQLADQDPLIAARTDEDGRPTVSLYGRVQQEVLASTLAEEHGIEVEFSDASVLHVERPRGTGSAVERFNTDDQPVPAPRSGSGSRRADPGSGLVFDARRAGPDMPLFLFKSAEGFATVMRAARRADARARAVRLAGHRLPGDADRRRLHARPTGRRRRAGRSRPPSTTASSRRSSCARPWSGPGSGSASRCSGCRLEVPTEDASAVQRLLARWGAELAGQTSAGDLTRLEARLVAARLHELQRQLPDLTGGEGVLESRFDGYQPVRGRPPVRLGWVRAPESAWQGEPVPRFTRAELESFRGAEVPDLVGPGDAAAVRRHQPGPDDRRHPGSTSATPATGSARPWWRRGCSAADRRRRPA